MNQRPDPQPGDDVRSSYRGLRRAMVDGDAAALDALLADGFTLTHISGYRQPKAEWLAQITDGRFVYHHITERDTTLHLRGSAAELDGRVETDATVYATRAPWRLRLSVSYTQAAGRWTAVRAVATTW